MTQTGNNRYTHSHRIYVAYLCNNVILKVLVDNKYFKFSQLPSFCWAWVNWGMFGLTLWCQLGLSWGTLSGNCFYALSLNIQTCSGSNFKLGSTVI